MVGIGDRTSRETARSGSGGGGDAAAGSTSGQGITVEQVEAAIQSLAEHLFQYSPMPLLHDEYDVRPAEVPRGDDDAGVRLGAGRSCLDARPPFEYLFGGQAPLPVPTAPSRIG